ncbi:MAG: hypothetical protein UX91_C0001G0131 [Candidatus Amesbacteria bacterium GW2011_GWB1_47_19]|nr:MAG: hypothetical protein UW51_C0001G0131 [Candidatus Amesbacteria bacterium GW2011_GWA1_44_24]KKU32143.1 MAG: hypothetical protein UX46_C0001G0130 [Candidatus Amesbacteria bacterium GW2011_GWC1_46_24]KKU67827.1 MAG: hypothetical protein UX91_C0001G0131 [Candidatus Amesbacteria bacterium GW2011_GWB1_47_19]OGD05010.1 MAG: hypothetical protein A2379_03860 [Candidatus Amesbacteria bacterium RIFOXYB1_FULL_47_13]HBC72426.1 hypothetical protein [Candidatus Amesbacteria bacterium]
MDQVILSLAKGFNPEKIVKGFFVAGLLMYCAFALIIVRQTGVMSETIEAKYNGVLRAFAWIHLLMAVGLVAVAVVIL